MHDSFLYNNKQYSMLIGLFEYQIGYSFGVVYNFKLKLGSQFPNSGQFPTIHTV